MKTRRISPKVSRLRRASRHLEAAWNELEPGDVSEERMNELYRVTVSVNATIARSAPQREKRARAK